MSYIKKQIVLCKNVLFSEVNWVIRFYIYAGHAKTARIALTLHTFDQSSITFILNFQTF
jgi:hypothetical protein